MFYSNRNVSTCSSDERTRNILRIVLFPLYSYLWKLAGRLSTSELKCFDKLMWFRDSIPQTTIFASEYPNARVYWQILEILQAFRKFTSTTQLWVLMSRTVAWWDWQLRAGRLLFPPFFDGLEKSIRLLKCMILALQVNGSRIGFKAGY
jgi:hypothetical protein